MRFLRSVLALSALPLMCANIVQAAGSKAPIEDGTYTCISSVGTLMLTLGEMTIAGNSHSFHPMQGPDTAGIYSYVPGQITWSGDIGEVTNAQITESDLNQGQETDDFWFHFNLDCSGTRSFAVWDSNICSNAVFLKLA